MQARVAVHVVRFDKILRAHFRRQYLFEQLNIACLDHVLNVAHLRVPQPHVDQVDLRAQRSLVLPSLELLQPMFLRIEPATLKNLQLVYINHSVLKMGKQDDNRNIYRKLGEGFTQSVIS